MIQITTGQQGETVLDGGSALLLIIMVVDVLLQCLDDDLLRCPTVTDVNSAPEGVVGSSTS